MKRTVTSHLDLGLSAPARLVFAIAAAQGSPFASESLALSVDGVPVVARELVDFTGNRMHVLDAIGSKVVMDYEAVVDGEAAPPPVDDFDLITYLRPSRYCESDSLAPTAAAEFSGTARRRAPRRGLHLGVGHPHVRPRLEPADRRRGPDVPRPPGRLPRLRAPVHRPAPRA